MIALGVNPGVPSKKHRQTPKGWHLIALGVNPGVPSKKHRQTPKGWHLIAQGANPGSREWKTVLYLLRIPLKPWVHTQGYQMPLLRGLATVIYLSICRWQPHSQIGIRHPRAGTPTPHPSPLTPHTSHLTPHTSNLQANVSGIPPKNQMWITI